MTHSNLSTEHKRAEAYKSMVIAIADTMDEEKIMLRTASNIRKYIIRIEAELSTNKKER